MKAGSLMSSPHQEPQAPQHQLYKNSEQIQRVKKWKQRNESSLPRPRQSAVNSSRSDSVRFNLRKSRLVLTYSSHHASQAALCKQPALFSSYIYLFPPKWAQGQVFSQFGNDDILKINRNKNESTWHLLKGNKITPVNWLVLHQQISLNSNEIIAFFFFLNPSLLK